MSAPTSTGAWTVTGIYKDSFDGLQLINDAPVPKISDHDVLVQIEAVSLNYRDLAIPKVIHG